MNFLKQIKDQFIHTKDRNNEYSAESLRNLYKILRQNKIIYDDNRELLIETLRSITEILIWGEKHDSSVIECCYENGLMVYFLDYLRQPNGCYICAQILQTLNILFQNLRDQMLLDYLLSNNHVNRIIIHKFDFSDDEITAFYFSFLRTLSLLLTPRSMNFFFSERDQRFPLYIEAIKFFNHPDRMVRISIRTLTLNVYRIRDKAAQRFILERTAVQYFSNLVWSIRNLVLDFDFYIRQNRNIQNHVSLQSAVDEYLDQIYYLQDIFSLDIGSVKIVLKDQMMNRLLIPICIFSLTKSSNNLLINTSSNSLEFVTTLFLLVEIFIIIDYQNMIEELTDLILSVDRDTARNIQLRYKQQNFHRLAPVTLQESLCRSLSMDARDNDDILRVININDEEECRRYEVEKAQNNLKTSAMSMDEAFETTIEIVSLYMPNKTDDEKMSVHHQSHIHFSKQSMDRPYFGSLINALQCDDDDQSCFYVLCLFLSLTSNPVVNVSLLESVGLTMKSINKTMYNTIIVDRICDVLQLAGLADSNIRIITLTLAIRLLKQLVYDSESKTSYLTIEHLKRVEHGYQRARHDLERHFKRQTILLDVFEDEYRQIQTDPLNIEDLMKQTSMFYPSTTTPLSGVEFIKRLPSGESEHSRRSIRVFLLIRSLVFELKTITDHDLPLTKSETLFKVNEAIDLNNCDLIACTIHLSDRKEHRFLVIQQMQFILVEREGRRNAWGVVRFCQLIQYVEVINDKDDASSLYITVHKSVPNVHAKSTPPLLSAKFTFDNKIQCLMAKNSLVEARDNAQTTKLSQIHSILEFAFDDNHSTSDISNKSKEELFDSSFS